MPWVPSPTRSTECAIHKGPGRLPGNGRAVAGGVGIASWPSSGDLLQATSREFHGHGHRRSHVEEPKRSRSPSPRKPTARTLEACAHQHGSISVTLGSLNREWPGPSVDWPGSHASWPVTSMGFLASLGLREDTSGLEGLVGGSEPSQPVSLGKARDCDRSDRPH